MPGETASLTVEFNSKNMLVDVPGALDKSKTTYKGFVSNDKIGAGLRSLLNDLHRGEHSGYEAGNRR
jgi:hypothetical protein